MIFLGVVFNKNQILIIFEVKMHNRSIMYFCFDFCLINWCCFNLRCYKAKNLKIKGKMVLKFVC